MVNDMNMDKQIRKLKDIFYDYCNTPYVDLFDTENIWIDDYFDNCIVLMVRDEVSASDLYLVVKDIELVNIKHIAMLGQTATTQEWLDMLDESINFNELKQ